MIEITNPKNCCGCGVCYVVCPASAIAMTHDTEEKTLSDFPKVDTDKCVDYGKCEIVCPMLSFKDNVSTECYALVSRDEDVVSKSSSGGAFTEICDVFASFGGNYMIFGAAFSDDMSVRHVGVDSIEKIAPMRKSKYVQSYSSDAFKEAIDALKTGKRVLFSGTPCQIAAFNNLANGIEGDYITVDILCHGVPSPRIFKKYIDFEETRRKKRVVKVSFRNKTRNLLGYESRNLLLKFENGKEIISSRAVNSYLRGYHSRLFYRDCCYVCPFAKKERVADITIADAWRVESHYSDLIAQKGVSMVLINTDKGSTIVSRIKKQSNCRVLPLDFGYNNNSTLRLPSKLHPKSKNFFELFRTHPFDKAVFLCEPKATLFIRFANHLLPTKVKKLVNILRKVRV
ncbi:F420H(2):quinone oxidoreductase [Clostridia bacterium]|nr:F420H(2):quinone oxidoreductase [Clostridia bacterium]